MGNYFLATHTYWSIAYTIDGMPGTLSHITHDTTTEPLPIGELAALVVR